jgi:predicted transcriptional regulator of viral defense system
MKQRVLLTPILERLRRLSSSMGGVFSYGDLFNIIATGSPLKNARTIKRLVREGGLFKICRGFYTTDAPDLWVLASRMKPMSYISMDAILARNGLIGTVPARSVSAVYSTGPKKVVQTPFGRIQYFSAASDLITFGTTSLPNGVVISNNEKAYIDLLYYYVKGARFVCDPICDVDLWKLDIKKIERYLKRYQNKRFVQFVRGSLNENT